ncbi:hypothetical protein FORC36_4825 (plasmid) [Vibrio vulnificus]|uniref:hypothetical protein n=1 Tax=Vibrio vulnificus TaxID=672 RepID=UPI000A20918E|nr:hypothetical protein [Vibrio vulnificus]ARN69342.1 hypothetical protein FORC36_4825 [Vibrio vulnificus]
MSFTTIWGNPEGEHILLESKSDLVTLLNKIGVIDFEDVEHLGIKALTRQMTEQELSDQGVEFDPEYPEDTELYLANRIEEEVYIAPIFDVNYLFEEHQLALKPIAKFGLKPYLLTEDNIEIDNEMYQFPCVVYANIFTDSDRCGTVEAKMWHVTPLHSMKKVSSLQEYEDSNSEIWKARLVEKLKFDKEKADYFAAKNQN